MKHWGRIALAFIVAVVLTALLGSLVQSQFNMAALLAMEVPVPLTLWLQTTALDLIGFAPLYAVVVAATFLVAFAVAAILVRLIEGHVRILFPLAGACGILATILLANSLLPMTPLSVTRFPLGIAALVLGGGIGGLAFASLLPRRARTV